METTKKYFVKYSFACDLVGNVSIRDGGNAMLTISVTPEMTAHTFIKELKNQLPGYDYPFLVIDFMIEVPY